MQRIKTIEQWREVLQQSKHKPCLILKFSMTCISSISALKEFKALETNLPKYLVIVQKDRDISNIIEKELKVKHESPQLLILKDEKGIWQATHYKIKQALLSEAISMYV
ncbi:bacillithiol system redox-active protein YtxJ [Lysinibacillus agricola]|uniref:Bacillithiol system redox-active protein YtxJ n=1 Tax=Lysinibacillus agricola TaxID=2590012 RepID=A0ABX7ASA1_9BACI|nr:MULTISPECIES: bacillithiol system redox-active protein YtxJ [Lysinibacillus]KOS61315.1 general stress protein [Lysinibacillus sp. FJAT-14222]QQP12840.1 bacillithiol system redox-active protein YtxJ [Lysinibacillus agricola]